MNFVNNLIKDLGSLKSNLKNVEKLNAECVEANIEGNLINFIPYNNIDTNNNFVNR